MAKRIWKKRSAGFCRVHGPEMCIRDRDYISLRKDWNVGQALEHIREVGMDAETIYTCYVRDNGRKLIGIVSLSTLVISSEDTKIMNIMRTRCV